MTDNYHTNGPVIVWTDYGHDGWSPRSYPTVLAALEAGQTHGFVITQRINLAETVREPKSSTPAIERAAKGGKARAAVLTPSRRSEIASNAATARWKPNGEKAFSVREAIVATGLSRSFIYQQMKDGKLLTRKVGRRLFIFESDLQSWVDNCWKRAEWANKHADEGETPVDRSPETP